MSGVRVRLLVAGLVLFHPATDVTLVSDSDVANFIEGSRSHGIGSGTSWPVLTLMTPEDVEKHLAASVAAGRYSPSRTRSGTRSSNGSPPKSGSGGSSEA